MKKINILFVLLFAFLLLGISSCDNDDDVNTGNGNGSFLCDGLLTAPGDLLILNEGGFGVSNASLSTLSEVQSGIVQDLVGTLGDVAQSITFHNEKLYVVVNNSSKIEVFCQHAYEKLATIDSLPSPRFMAVVNDEKAYVSNFYSESISIVDLTSNTISGSIDYAIENNGFGERNNIEIVGNTAYIVDADNVSISRINTETDELAGFIGLNYTPRDMVKDADGNLWVFTFEYDANFAITDPKVFHINTSDNTIANTYDISFPVGYTSTYLQISETGDELYLLLDEVYETSISNFNLTQLADIPDSVFPYGFGVSADEKVYITDPVDYSQEGKLIEIDNSGTTVNEYPVGVAPSKIYFLD